ncbi:MAG: HAMP domain-containing protein [Deltaproteobacteria bacterium]|nr:MAG: HAMP domain-containing protein [Deltaproteobacteria bacterium]
MFFKTLTGRILTLSLLFFTVAIGTVTMLHIRREHIHITSSSRETAELMLAVIERAIASSMRVGNTRDVQAILETVGRDPHLAAVRIFNAEGRILKSSDPHEIGRRVNPHELAIFRRGDTHDVFTAANGDVIGVIKPIWSEPACASCHGRERKIIGILNVEFALAAPEEQMYASSRFFGMSMLVMIGLLTTGIVLIFRRFVRRPLQRISEKMTLVEEGNLSVRLEPESVDEVGQLIENFNSMVDKLSQAKVELEQCHYQQMERADRLASVGEMSAGIAHEIKNPLAAISGAITVLADDFPADDPRREVVAKVLEQIARLDKAATDLLYFGKPGKPAFTWVDVNDLLKQTLFFVAQHPEARNVHQVQELTRNLPPVWVDEKQLQQVFFNVIINAIQAMKSGGTLLIQTDLRQSGDCRVVTVLIGDSGPGIPPADLERIFLPFYTTKTQGTGLGLAICRQLMEQQGGAIHVASKVGEGTRVAIELPVKVQGEA